MPRSQPRRLPSTSVQSRRDRTRVAAAARSSPSTRRVLFATHTWTGAGDGTHWSNAANWDINAAPDTADDLVVFPAGPTNQNTNQDIANLAISRVSLNGGGYTIGGANGLTLTDDIRGNNTTGTNTVSVPITLGADMSYTQATGGSLVVGGTTNLAHSRSRSAAPVM